MLRRPEGHPSGRNVKGQTAARIDVLVAQARLRI
jgi:hypothetical protein